ncbi:MAG: AarF/ABC1/UbiB kinase family protein [Armatimonadota bacterium]
MIPRRKHLSRLKEIGTVLARHGWGHIVARFGLAGMLRLRRRGIEPEVTPEPEHLLYILQELGPTFVKLGQLLSTRPDILPEPYIAALTKLQDTANTVPVDQIKSIIQEELGQPVESVFAYFDEVPLAAASLGQVHAATLHDGTQVIIKVQRPGITKVIDRDIDIMYMVSKLLERRWERVRTYAITEIVDEFAITIHEELDYTIEANNTDRLRAVLLHEKNARVPKIMWDIVTKRVLTMERIDGIKITDIERLNAAGFDTVQIADRLSAVMFKQIFIDGFFHADPHPGNILVTPDQEIALLDAGQVRQLDLETRTGLLRMVIAFEHQDTHLFTEVITEIGITRGEVNTQALSQDLEKVLRQFYNVPAQAMDIGKILIRVMDVSARHKIRLPVGFSVIGKVMVNLESINRMLDPNFNFTKAVRPYIARAVREELSPEDILTDSYRSLIDLKRLIFGLPDHLHQLLHKAVSGTLRIEFKHKGLEELESRLDKITNRLAFALIVGSTIIGSSIIVISNRQPTGILGLPMLGVAGYLFALVMGMWLLISIIRSGKL